MAAKRPRRDRFNHLQGKVRWGVCEICLHPYPESQLQRQEGYDVCVDDYEPGGREQSRDRERSRGAMRAAQLESINRTPKFTNPDGITQGGSGVIIPNITDTSPFPVPLTAGGGAVEVTLTGNYLTAANLSTFDFGDAGITSSSHAYGATGLSSTFDLVAAGGVTPGLYDMTITDANGLRSIRRKAIEVS